MQRAASADSTRVSALAVSGLDAAANVGAFHFVRDFRGPESRLENKLEEVVPLLLFSARAPWLHFAPVSPRLRKDFPRSIFLLVSEVMRCLSTSAFSRSKVVAVNLAVPFLPDATSLSILRSPVFAGASKFCCSRLGGSSNESAFFSRKEADRRGTFSGRSALLVLHLLGDLVCVSLLKFALRSSNMRSFTARRSRRDEYPTFERKMEQEESDISPSSSRSSSACFLLLPGRPCQCACELIFPRSRALCTHQIFAKPTSFSRSSLLLC
ncbi:hypothetical protein TGFOU_299980 [Toxoplasma gondii FOU]|uniref:Uncharacterized protein n=1 Tax=Toxoplasma gondii FOU TaxID=943167 RepID=A0A086JQW1_TOXGO|nr:hypothetical protein TGFOU_299980 [Toxoplasma gondii FOU]